MKLIQKKCPNCGADLEFDKSEKEVVCKYCNAKFSVEKDANDLVQEIFNPEDFARRQKAVAKAGKVITIIAGIIFILIFIMFIVSVLRMNGIM